MTTLVPWEPISFDRLYCRPTVCQALHSAQQMGDSCLTRRLDGYTEHSSRNIRTQSKAGWAGRLRVLGKDSVLHTLAELKRLHAYASVSSSMKWDQ